MIKNIQIQVLPKQLDSQNLLLKLVADKINTKTSSINYIEILKKSIDSRQKEIKINLIINVYINEKFIKKKICTPDYKDVNNAEEIIMLADGNGHFTKQIGLDMNTSNFGGLRSLRYSMLIEDGEVKKINVEDPGRFDVSDAQSMLDSL